MKTYTKTIWNICACMLIILLGGCADDDIIRNDCGLTMPKFTSQILLLFSKVLHILENLLLKNFTGLKVVS